MKHQSIISFIGLAGVAPDESPRARYWGRVFEAPMLVLALWIVIEWYLVASNRYPESWGVLTNRIVWAFFVVETGLLLVLVRDKRRYLLSNWINLLIIAVGIPVLWHNQPYAGALRSLRILLLFSILLEMSSTVRQMLSRNNVGLTLLVALILIVMAGTSIAAIDPAIETPWDGIWWAWVTVTTVGYGDLVPESPQGKIFGGLLMVIGLGLFSLMTASFSAFLITREEEEIVEKEETLLKKGEALIEKEAEVVAEEQTAIDRLEEIEKRLESLESGLAVLIERIPAKKMDEPAAAKDPGENG